MPGETIFAPHEGDLVFDKTKKVVAEAMDCGPTTVYVRPVGGGVEWEVHRADLRSPSVSEELAAKANVANTSSRLPRAL
ncbi:hypothetical protein [Streptomyces sp. NPDC006631]|uniref:hypothetical protein n=1 Tax=Streptomyces sp. NPDC006631 TaxID=3364752 RepID=UPI0036850086